MLCKNCEQRLSVVEQYVNNMINGGALLEINSQQKYLQISKIDYNKLKIFQLSILWRAGVSRLEPFSTVELGPHEHQLRKMILLNKPGAASEYGCIMGILMKHGKIMTDLIVPPTRGRIGDHTAYRFIFGGLIFTHIVSSHLPSNLITDSFAQTDGSVTVELQEINEFDHLVDAIMKMKILGKLSND